MNADKKKQILRKAAKKWMLNPDNREANKNSVKRWIEAHPNYTAERYKEKHEMYKKTCAERYRRLKENEPWVVAYPTIKQRAKTKNMEFNLDVEYIKNIWTDKCPVLDIPLYSAVFKSGGKRNESKARPRDNSPTIDRINSSKGYIKGNVCIMSHRANMIKNCGTLEEHKKVVAFLEKINESNIA